MKKYGFIIVFSVTVLVTVPFVIKSFVDKKQRTEGLEEPRNTNEVIITPTATPIVTVTADNTIAVTPSEDVINTPSVPEQTSVVTATQTVTPTPKPSAGNLATIDTKNNTSEYFSDALFIGDSRTEGIKSYGTAKNADYYSYVGLSVYKIDDKNNPTKSGTQMTLDEYLNHKQYKKVYVMLGFNEVGYPKNNTVKKYSQLLDRISSAQPDAKIYICANLLVTAKCSATDKYSHNPDILQLNSMLSELADGEKRIYIDVNEYFGDGNGNLRDGISGDGTHLYAKYYPLWCDWLLSKAE